MTPIQKNEIKIGETYEVSDPIIGRVDTSYLEILADKGDTFEVKDLLTNEVWNCPKTLDFYELEEYDLPMTDENTITK